MKNAALILLACLFGLVLSHHATAYSGKELYRSCSAKESNCTAYMHGFIDGMIMGYTAHGTLRGYCPPVTGVSVAKGRAIIEKFLREHPERLNNEASILAGLALSEAFPCPAK